MHEMQARPRKVVNESISLRHGYSTPRDLRLCSLGAACTTSPRRRRTATAWASELAPEAATSSVEVAPWGTLVHITTATVVALEVAAWAVALLIRILGITLFNIDALASHGVGVRGYGGLKGLWASKVDEGAVLI